MTNSDSFFSHSKPWDGKFFQWSAIVELNVFIPANQALFERFNGFRRCEQCSVSLNEQLQSDRDCNHNWCMYPPDSLKTSDEGTFVHFMRFVLQLLHRERPIVRSKRLKVHRVIVSKTRIEM